MLKRDFFDDFEKDQPEAYGANRWDPCRPHPSPPCFSRPCPCCRPGPPGPRGPVGPSGKSAYQIAREHGFVGTEEEWLESLKGEPGSPGPFLSSYMEALANGQIIRSGRDIVFDLNSIDDVGNNITLDATGTVFTIRRTGLYHVEWNLNLAPDASGAASAVVGIVENGEGASGAASSAAGGFASGTIIAVEAVPFTLSLRNYGNAITIENPTQWVDSAASIRIVRFADGASA